ncbi:MAG TPA: 50S ribosomal protein L15 [Terrimesophilobacter sp.]|nr:50S ribosomal protein L15 [Terrimesophilobacter sp.]
MADEAPKKTPAKKPATKAAAKPAAKAAATKAAAPKAAAKAPAKSAAPKAAAAKAAPKTSAAKTAPKAAASKPAAAKAAPTATATATAAKAPAAKAATSASATAAAKSASAKKAASKDVVSRPQVLKMHHLRPAPGAKTAKTRVGRGEASKGKTAGRGTKGTKARYQVRVGLEGGNLNSVMRTPKLRGFKNPFRVEYQVVNLERLAELYPKGGDVTVSDLVAKGAVRKNEKVKVLGAGEIDVKLNVAVDKISGSAEQKILAAGGSVK